MRNCCPYREALFQGRLWTPRLLPGLVAWYDAADISTISIATGVTEWRDKSGGGWHMGQATAAKQPTYQAIGFNGLPGLYFDSTDDVLGCTITGYSSISDLFFAAAHKFDFVSGGPGIPWNMVVGHRSGENGALSGAILLQRMQGDLQIGCHYTDIADTRISVAVASLAVPRISTLGRSGGTSGNGGAVTVSTFPASSPVTNASQSWTSSASTFVQIGGRQQAATNFCTGHISEVILGSRKQSVLERERVEGYLAHKWRLVDSLPAYHPFRNRPPMIGD